MRNSRHYGGRRKRKDRRRVALIPGILTLGNLSFGVLAILSAMDGHYHRSAWFIVVGMVLDGLDGWAARTTKTASPFGMQLDSLADVVSFGVAPALLAYRWTLAGTGTNPTRPFAVAMTLFYVACVAIRLARFNMTFAGSDMRFFSGLPSPAAALMITTVVMNFPHPRSGHVLTLLPLTLLGVLGVLMVSNLRYRSSKALEIHHRWPAASYAFMALLIALVASYHRYTLFVMAVIYVISGPTRRIWFMFKRTSVHKVEPAHPTDHPTL